MGRAVDPFFYITGVLVIGNSHYGQFGFSKKSWLGLAFFVGIVIGFRYRFLFYTF